MRNIEYRDKKDLTVLDINEITDESLLFAFTNNVNATVYITKNNKLEGIITIGDYNRNKKIINDNLINKKFTVVDANKEESIIEGLFYKNEKIKAIPVIDSNKTIIGEYCRKVENQKFDNSIIKSVREFYIELYLEMLVGGYDLLFIRIGHIPTEYHYIVEEIAKNTNEQIVICGEISLEDITKVSQDKKIFLLDIGNYDEGIKSRQFFYQKKNIDHMIYTKDVDKIKEAIKHISRLYKKIAVLQYGNEEKYIKTIINHSATTNVVLLDINKLVQDNDEIKYTETCKDLDDVEVIFTLTTAIKKPYIIYKDRIIPCMCVFEKIDTSSQDWIEWDIAVNIIPELERNNVKTILINNPELESGSISSLNDGERGALHTAFESKTFWKEDYPYIDQIKAFLCFTNKRGYVEVENCETDMVNYNNGIRYTVGNPKEYKNTIYLYGPCLVRGALVTDRYTIGSFLREKIGKDYYIENRGNTGNIKNIAMRIPSYKPGDVVILFVWDSKPYEKLGIKLHSIASVFNKIVDLKENMWDSVWHANSYVIKYVADEVYNIFRRNVIESNNCISNNSQISFSSDSKNSLDDVPKELKEWVDELKEYKIQGKFKIGSIVMNCNPFTLGHRYLIENAKAQVDYLFIFVVEEDKSFFKFEDRLEMVKRGVADLGNVIVLSSGRYIISTETLPGYFNKDQLQNVKLDASADIEIFANIIAKCLNITVRFAGEEPIDAFTRQYNETMKRMLPGKGIEFVEIPRICKGNEVISASRVRKLLKEKEYEYIKRLVPITTYKYLEMKYFE
ncbi:MAG: adenylyltransferase/cytidyltransferase family protein [Candidatus Galacturonibacter soehngenii]|nr:adenylyltransferase/cytidyltransferase family protein [Candidatus Galacturonibacter soehngenii]